MDFVRGSSFLKSRDNGCIYVGSKRVYDMRSMF